MIRLYKALILRRGFFLFQGAMSDSALQALILRIGFFVVPGSMHLWP